MNSRFKSIFILLILALVVSACGGSDKENEAKATPSPTKAATQTPTAEPTATKTPEPTATPEVVLGEEQRNDYGGFAFRPIPGYEVEEEASLVGMDAPDGDPDIGPAVLMLSYEIETGATLEQVLGNFTQELGTVQVLDQHEVTVGGVAGLAVDLGGSDDEGRDVAGRMVVALPASARQFLIAGIAPPERWEGELEPLFEVVLASVSFFEPVAGGGMPQPQPAPPGDLPWVEQSPGWTMYSNANYVQDVAVYDGVLWAATEGGLTAWDPASGELIGKWTTQDGLVHNEAYAVTVCPLPEPHVVVGTRGGLSLYDPETDTWENWTSDTSELERDFVTGLACHPESQTLLIGYNGMVVSFYHAGTGQWQSYNSFDDGLRGAVATDFAIVGDLQEVWVAGSTAVSVITPDGIFAYDDDNSTIPNDTILSVAADDAGNVWLGTAKGLIQVNGENSFTLYDKENITDYPVGMSFIEGLDFASDGTLWASTSSAQVCHFDPATATCIGSYSREPGMAGSFNKNLIVDDQDNVYYTSDSEGVSFFDGSAWHQLYLEGERLAQNDLSAIVQGHDGAIWIGTKTHSAQRFWAHDPDGDAWQGFAKEIPSLAINTLYADPRSGMWVGHGSGASFYDQNGHWTHLSKDQGLPGGVTALAVDASDRMWFGTGFDGLGIWDGEQFTYLTEESGDLPDDRINAILADGEVVWVSTSKGLLRFENDERTLFNEDNSDLPRDDVFPLALDVDGTLLVGAGGFLMRLEDGGQMTQVTRINDYINSIAVGPNGEIWLGTYSAGAFHFDGQEWTQFTAADGLASPTFLDPTQILVDDMGTVWFANSFGGLAHYVP
jgi:ligand-binding sensor domain-containing protein